MTGPTRDALPWPSGVSDAGRAAAIDAWLAALDARHRQALRPAEFHKAVRALSARYVERRGELPRRSPLDSAGKRAAFAAFYAPLHFLTLGAIAHALPAPGDDAAPGEVLDLGCGTGVSGAAWAMARPGPVRVTGIDRDRWALGEAAWNWRTLGITGRAVQGDLAGAFQPRHASESRRLLRRDSTVICGWTVNELDDAARESLLPRLVAHVVADGGLLIVEPIAKRAAPWWAHWSGVLVAEGARIDEWAFPVKLPPALSKIDAAAGFRRNALKARSIYLPCRTGGRHR